MEHNTTGKIYYGLRHCDDIPNNAAGVFTQKQIDVAVDHLQLFFHSLESYALPDGNRPLWEISFPLIEVIDEAPHEHRIVLQAWTLFIKTWTYYRSHLGDPSEPIKLTNIVKPEWP